jgi:hypothetical protein
MGKVYFVKEPGGDSGVLMDAALLRDETEIREPLENLGMEFHVYHDWALTQSMGYFTVAKSKADFLLAAFDLHYGRAVKREADHAKRKAAGTGEDCSHCPKASDCALAKKEGAGSVAGSEIPCGASPSETNPAETNPEKMGSAEMKPEGMHREEEKNGTEGRRPSPEDIKRKLALIKKDAESRRNGISGGKG